jgi:hypothetical protein
MGEETGGGRGTVTRRGTDPRPLGGLADLAELLGGESDRSRRLLGGLAVGALAGAAVAGTLLRLRYGRRPKGD